MTRRKWTKLRRQRPELFGVLPPFEKWNSEERTIMRSITKEQAIATMTAWVLKEKTAFYADPLPFTLPRHPPENPFAGFGGKWTFTVDGRYVDPVEESAC